MEEEARQPVYVDAFRDDLTNLINHHSKENGSGTPDFILAEYLQGCLDVFDRTSQKRREWYGANGNPSISKDVSK